MDLSPIADRRHELVGRVVRLNSGGPLMTITAVVSQWLLETGSEPVGEPPPTEFRVVYFNSIAADMQREVVNERWCELLTATDLDALAVS